MEAYLRHGGGLIGYDPNPLLPPHIQTQIQAGKKTQNPWKISFKMNVQSQGLFYAHFELKYCKVVSSNMSCLEAHAGS